MLMIFARASKCVGRTEIIEFGRHNLNKFRKLDMLKNGAPSEATLCRVEQGIDDLELANRMQEFVEFFQRRLFKADGGMEIICVDGKAERGTVQGNGRNFDIVSAYSYTEEPELGHGRIESRTYRIFDGLDIIADKEKRGGNMTIIEYESKAIIINPSSREKSGRKNYLLSVNENIKRDKERLDKIIARLQESDTEFTSDNVVSRFHNSDNEQSFSVFMGKQIARLKRLGKMRTSETYTVFSLPFCCEDGCM